MMIMMLVVTIMSCIMLVMMIDIERKRYEVKFTRHGKYALTHSKQLTIIEYMGKNILVVDTCTLWQIYTIHCKYIWVSFPRTGKMSVLREFFFKVEGWCGLTKQF